jgi:hypothetical protein
MRIKEYCIAGKKFELRTREYGLSIVLETFCGGKRVGSRYSAKTETARSFRQYFGSDASDELVKIAADDLRRLRD